MESMGIHKREILVDRVKEGRETQQEAKDQFKTALERFTELTEFDGGKLKKTYDRLNRELERSEAKAKEVSSRIEAIEDVSDELFREWEKELKSFKNAEYRRISESKLEATYAKYEDLIAAMKRAEKSIAPVLDSFRDQVLFLKHNLNAQAIASLDTQTEVLKSDIVILIEQMESSIAEADSFIDSMSLLE
jgi:chromosome segregation ATPase